MRRSPRARPVGPVLAGLMLAGLMLAGCGDGDDIFDDSSTGTTEPAPSTTGPVLRSRTLPADPQFAAVVEGLCMAAGQAGDGSVAQARTTFFDRSHDAIHEVADSLDDHERPLEARLLETKARVEAAFDGDGEPAALAADLADLADAASLAYAAIGADASAGLAQCP